MISVRRTLRALSVVLLASLFSLGVVAQGVLAQQAPRFVDRTEVNVTNVEVFVADAKGRPVTGLGKDDFELVVDGEAVEISNFYAIANGQAPAPQDAALRGAAPEDAPAVPAPEDRRPRLIIYVDNVNIAARSRKQIFDALREQVGSQADGDIRYMVVSRDHASESPPEVRLDFTDSSAETLAVLDRIQGEIVTGSSRFQDERIRIQQATNERRTLYARILDLGQQLHTDAQVSIRVLHRFLAEIAALPGRKALLYVSDGIDLRPAEGLLEVYEKRYQNFFTQLETDINVSAEVARLDVTPLMEEALRYASTHRVAFYTLNAGASAAMTTGSADFEGSLRGSRLNRDMAFGEASRRQGLQIMAERTGGRAGIAKNKLAATLTGLMDDYRNYYSLGFTADSVPGKERRIEVRVGDKKLRVRHRLSFREKTPQEEMSERVMTALAVAEDGGNPLGIQLRFRDPEPHETGHFVVPVLVEIPLGKLVLLPDDQVHRASVSVYVAARDSQGRTSEVVRHTCPVRIPNAEVLNAMGQSMVCGVRLMMRRGPQEVAVVAHDEISGTASTARWALDVVEPGG